MSDHLLLPQLFAAAFPTKRVDKHLKRVDNENENQIKRVDKQENF